MLEGIDEKTHHPYRQTSFDKVTQNMKSFTDAGGTATASMLVFEHNEHCIEEYKNLAFTKLGCKFVYIKASQMYDDILRKPKTIKAKARHEYRNDDIPIKCLTKELGEITVDVECNIWPCCYMYNDVYMKRAKWRHSKTFAELKTNIFGRFLGELPICSLKCKGIEEAYIERLSYNDYMRQKIENTRH